MPVLPRLAGPPPLSRRGAPSLPSPRLPLAPPAAFFWKSTTKWSKPFAAPRQGLFPEERDPLLLAGLRGARLRDQESRRSDPLFVDPYAAVLLSLDAAYQDTKETIFSHAMSCKDHYSLATKFVDDKLQNLMSSSDDLRQIVLLTDGMDTRAYRLSWPRLSVVYDVSPGRVFNAAAQQLRGVGAKVSRNCVLLHTPLETPDLQEVLCKNGFDGNNPSLWILQGLPLFTSTSLENLLLVISNLATKGSIFLGELPCFPEWTALVKKQDRLENLFFTQGFRVSFVHYENVAKDIGLELAFPLEQHGGVLFVAEQLRFSDAQMESFRMHFERIEEDADEEGFEEL